MNNMENDVSLNTSVEYLRMLGKENFVGSKFQDGLMDEMNPDASYPKIESSMENLMIDDHFDSKFKVE